MLEITYPSQDQIPEAFRPLFEEKDGAFFLSKVNGLKTQKDIDTISGALSKERNDHKAAREALKAWEGLNRDEVTAKLSRFSELEAAAAGKLPEEKITQMVESRLSQKTAPLEQKLKTVEQERDDFKNKFETTLNQLYTRDRNDAVRAVALEMKVHASAIPDIELTASVMLERVENDGVGTFITKSGIPGVTPGLDVKAFMKEMQKVRRHWWPESNGGGSNGGGPGGGAGEKNPFSAEHWNLTEQGRITREQGITVAQNLAKAAGTTVGGPRPVAKK